MSRQIELLMKIFVCLLLFFPGGAFSQTTCPPNLGFELGSFQNWKLYTGQVAADGAPILDEKAGNQRLISTANFIDKDPYGDFPLAAPNGGSYCIKIGHDLPDKKADRVTYSFQVPSDPSNFSIVFNYAIVLQNADHEEHEQPRFTVKVFNETRAEYIECSSFDFVSEYNQPDFLVSEKDRKVSYKPWTSAALNLNSYKGDQVRLEFTVNDCAKGGHFAYAYFDVVEKCSSSVTGNVICPGADNVSLQAPDYFSAYEWYTGNFSQLLGTGKIQTINAPNIGDSFAVVLVPFTYLGCRDTFYTKITPTADPIRLVVRDSVHGCSDLGIDITRPELTQGSSMFLDFEYYSDVNANQAVKNPNKISTSGTYFVKAVNKAGCMQVKPVIVNIFDSPSFGVIKPPAVAYPQTVNLATLTDNPQLTYTFWEDEELTRPVQDPRVVGESGIYYIKGANVAGCFSIEAAEIKVTPALFVPNSFTPNGDGRNDRFLYKALGKFKAVSFFKIYNRWGQEIFNAGNTGASWDGTYNGKPVESGTYVWMLRATDWLNKTHVAQGTVVLIR